MTGLIFALALCICIVLVPLVQDTSYTLTAILFTIMGFALYGPHMLFAVGCLDVTHKDAAGSITGFRGLFSYVGAAMAGVPVIMVKNSWAWSGVYIYAVIAILLTTLSLALLSGCIGYNILATAAKRGCRQSLSETVIHRHKVTTSVFGITVVVAFEIFIAHVQNARTQFNVFVACHAAPVSQTTYPPGVFAVALSARLRPV